MIITSCMDKVSRVWVETILPDDGLDDMEQIDPECAPSDPKRYTHRHKKRFLRRLSKIRSDGAPTVMSTDTLSVFVMFFVANISF